MTKQRINSRTPQPRPRARVGKTKQAAGPETSRLIGQRLRWMLPVVISIGVILGVRTFWIQVVWADRLSAMGENQNELIMELPAPRGEIFDRHGTSLAINWHNKSFFTYPRNNNITQLARYFSTLTESSERELSRTLYNRRGRFTWLARQVDDLTAVKIRNWPIDDLYTMPEMSRAYPHAPAGGGLVGFVNRDNQGLAGIEYSCEKWLAGRAGRAVVRRDARGRQYAMARLPMEKPHPGCRVELTLDLGWQEVVEDVLTRGIREHGARAGMIVLLDCRTGEILAMADARAKGEFEGGGGGGGGPDNHCRVVTDVFEPGSSFKLVTFAAALSEGQLCPADSFDAEMGQARFSNRLIRDDKKYGIISVADAFRVSSNIVTGRIANQIGGKTVRRWAKLFGFGERTDVLLPAEQRGAVPQHRWSEYVTAAFSIGHGVSVTTLQLANAYATLANGGLLMKPYLVSQVVDDEGKIVHSREPEVMRRVLSPDVAGQLLTMARAVVTDGTAKQVCDPEFPLAGKTGTAEKPDLETGRMLKNKYIASFAGFWPADRPQIVGVVVLDEPEPIHYGGWTCAPMLLDIFRRGSCIGRPAMRQPPRQLAEVTRESAKINPEKSVNPASSSASEQSSFWSSRRVAPYATDGLKPGRIPRVIGLTAREAMMVLARQGIETSISGIGRVVRQRPAPGALCPPGEICRLSLR